MAYMTPITNSAYKTRENSHFSTLDTIIWVGYEFLSKGKILDFLIWYARIFVFYKLLATRCRLSPAYILTLSSHAVRMPILLSVLFEHVMVSCSDGTIAVLHCDHLVGEEEAGRCFAFRWFVKYSEPSLQRQHLFLKTLPLK